MEKKKISIPVSATYRVEDNGEVVRIDAEYKEFYADDIARFLLRQFGAEAIFGGEGEY